MRTTALLLFTAILAFGCSGPVARPFPYGTPSGAVCPDGSLLTYETFGRSFMEHYCTRCHSTTNVGDARNGAPPDLNWNVLATIRENADRMDAIAASGPLQHNNVMPPTAPFPIGSERTNLGIWLACGAP